MTIRARQSDDPQDNAYFEHITIPPGQSFLWRMDDYPWRRCVWNYHPEFEIHLIRHSSGLSYVGDHIGHFDAGQLVLVGSNLPHNWVTPSIGDEKLLARDIVVQFDPARIRQTARSLPEVSEIEPLFQRAARGLEFTGETARLGAGLLEQMGNGAGLTQLCVLLDLLALMAASREYRMLATPQFLDQFRPGTPSDLETLEKTLDFIQRHFLDGPSLSDVASIVGMSDSSFSRFFKTHTGNTFSDHVTSLKMWTARKLLSDSSLAITEICFEAGFSNISNFNRIFLSQAGMTPSQYRRAARSRSVRPVGSCT
jgi:AraC-like DNA-binding protein/mannose-6-phosphate isomerase-like protein (cupin superfamily)